MMIAVVTMIMTLALLMMTTMMKMIYFHRLVPSPGSWVHDTCDCPHLFPHGSQSW